MWWNLNRAHLRSYWFDKSTFHGLLTQQVALRPIPMSLVALVQRSSPSSPSALGLENGPNEPSNEFETIHFETLAILKDVLEVGR